MATSMYGALSQHPSQCWQQHSGFTLQDEADETSISRTGSHWQHCLPTLLSASQWRGVSEISHGLKKKKSNRGCTDVSYINGNPVEMLNLEQMTYVGKVTYSAIPYFPVNQFFAKFSILFLYHRIFSVNKVFVRCIYALGALQIIYSVATLFVSIFGCSPIAGSWDPKLAITAKCINHNQYLAGSETVNSFVDFAMVGLAIWMIQDLRMKNSMKWKLSIPFILGGASGIIGFVKIGETYHSTSRKFLCLP